ncbi:Por secretion system C-terminal sorting domain-containing protein [Chryseolinea serpens]|uniref:Por secretion system C-terminal sorting domain-containing protein n=2 Tax=Chryseolinea serpens TaxID=947013 RepID=A0A1M5P1U1_9BACT|nr:Por secretion system C-terminal sorting domain-containing protein [Chryseolinea serpens]
MLLFTLFISPLSTYSQLSPSPGNFQGVWGGKSIFGDLDNDGDLDLIVSGNTNFINTATTIYRNDGNGNFSVAATLAGTNDGSVDLGDYDQDGLIDILMVGGVEGMTSVGTLLFKNQGNFVFGKTSHSLPSIIYGEAKFADFDNDGDEDVVMLGSNISDNYHDIFINTNGVFKALDLNLTKYSDPAVSIGDYDLDSDLDYVVVGAGMSNAPAIFKNEGDNNFVPVTIYDNPMSDGAVAWGDFDNDRYLDLVIMGVDQVLGTDQVILLKNAGADKFTKMAAPFDGVSGGNVVPGDMDNDGDLDVIVTGWKRNGTNAASTTAYVNTNGAFAKQNVALPALIFSHVALGDADNDLDLDLVVSGSEIGSLLNGKTYLYINSPATANTRPTAPASLQATPDGQQVKLSWNAGADGQTPSNGLTYALYVNSAPGQDHSGESLSTPSGFRKVVKMGIAQHSPAWRVDNLAPGTYYWGVQSIDGAFMGSPFSAEGSFVIGNSSPVLTTLSSLAEEAGSSITIKGKNFIGTSSVKLKGTEAVFQVINSTTLKVVIPMVTGAGNFEVTNPAGKGTSSQSFCVIPAKPVLTGNTTVCPGTEPYQVNGVAGVVYHWTVDNNNGEIVEDNNNNVKIKWRSRGQYVVRVAPQSCQTGVETTLAVEVKGPERKQISGNVAPKTESFERYSVSYVGGENYQWTLTRDGQTVGSSNESDFIIKWTQPGTYSLRVSTTNAECAATPVEEVLTFDVAKNAFSYASQMPFDITSGLSLADLDNDGDQDFIAGGNRIFENIMPAGFQEKTSSLRVSTNVRFADTDGDNDLDILMTYGGTIAEFENQGDFKFGAPKKVADKLSTPAADYIDFDNDGDLDIVSMGTASILVFERLALNDFRRIEAYTPVETASLSGSMDIIDFNADGRQDIVTSAGGVFLNTGAKSFVSKIITYPTPVGAFLKWEDMDQDGDFDLAAYFEPNKIELYQKNGDAFVKFYADADAPASVSQFIDMNGDGWKDLIVGQNPVRVSFYDRNNHSFTSPLQRFDAFGEWRTNESSLSAVTDLNKDGKNDLMLYCKFLDNSSLQFFINNSETMSPPTPVQSLASKVAGNEATLTWQGDAGKSFEIILGTTPGALDRVSTRSDLASGYRKVPIIGNAGNRNSFTFSNLAPGTYYWSVQAIDNALNGSVFVTPLSFTIQPTLLKAPDQLRIASTSMGISLTWRDNSDNETGFIIERSSGVAGNFVQVGTVASGVTVFNESISLDENQYYRVKAFNGVGQSYYSEIIGTPDAIISTFPYVESFEKTTSAWHQLDNQEESQIYFNQPTNWTRYSNVFGSIDGKYSLRMEERYESTAYIAAVESPYFDMSRMTNPCLVFYVSGPHQDGGIRVYGSADEKKTWNYLWGFGTGSTAWDRQQVSLLAYKSNISKLRIVGLLSSSQLQVVAFDNVRVVECPTNPGSPKVSQSGSSDLLLTWVESLNASQYFLERSVDNGSYTLIGTLDAPVNSYLDKNLAAGKTYRYRMYAVNNDGPAYSNYVNFSATVLSNAPVVEHIADQEMKVMTQFSVEMKVTDDTPVASLNITAESGNTSLLPSGNISIEKKVGAIVIKIVSNTTAIGSSLITIKVNDGTYTTESAFNLTIKEKNDAPVIVSQKQVSTINEDASFTMAMDQLVVEDADNDISQLKLMVLPGANYSVSGNVVSPANNFNGTLSVALQVSDNVDVSEPFEYTLNVIAVNDAPVIKGTSPWGDFKEDQPISIPLSMLQVEDPDSPFPGDFSVIIKEGQSYTVQPGTVIPAKDFYGTLTVPIQVSDGLALSNVYELKLTVTPVNDPPVIEGTKKTFASIDGEPVEIDVKDLVVVDPDNEFPGDHTLIVLTGDHYTVEGNMISPAKGFGGTLEIPVQVSDGIDVSNTYSIAVTVDAVLAAEHNLDDVTLYPNPNRGKFRVSLPSITESVSISISDSMGRKLYDNSTIRSEIALDLEIAPGMYVLEMTSGSKKVIKKFMVN